MLNFERLEWDAWNAAHIARHEVTRDEVEQVCRGPYEMEDTYAGRFRVMGPTLLGRMLTVIVAPAGCDAYYVVTARPMRRRERRRYDELREGHPS